MKLYHLLLTGMLACMACNTDNKQAEENKKDTAVVDDTYISTTPIPLDGCYSMISNQDTATMRLNVVDSFVTGHLSYHPFQKDHNDGSVKGVVRDNLIIMDYTFRSEGTMSVRQVVFKMAGTSLVEGYGDLNTGSDTVRFKNPGQLAFLEDRPFLKVDCIQ